MGLWLSTFKERPFGSIGRGIYSPESAFLLTASNSGNYKHRHPRRDMPPQIVGIGSCGIDYFAIVPRLLAADEKINADRLEIHAGGVTGNNLTQVARLGASAGWLGLIGDADTGRLITKPFPDA